MRGSDGSSALTGANQIAEANGMATHIRSASRATGVSFEYLMAQAGKESAFISDAKSTLSSAAGLFQFTKGTWLELIKLHGAAHGLAEEAAQIERTPHGDYVVADAGQRQKILALRRDPALSSLIAGEYAKDNKHWLEKSLHRHVGSTELYLAHFLGPAGAVKLLKARAEDPTQSAADLVPQAAAKNKTMFFEADHSAQSVATLYDRVRQVMENPAHPPHRQTPPADLAVAALHYGNLPWSEGTAETAPSTEKLLASVRLSIQAYTAGSLSNDKISAPMPPPLANAPSPEAEVIPSSEPFNNLLKALFG